jgi:hypothetical protein
MRGDELCASAGALHEYALAREPGYCGARKTRLQRLAPCSRTHVERSIRGARFSNVFCVVLPGCASESVYQRGGDLGPVLTRANEAFVHSKTRELRCLSAHTNRNKVMWV